jgi:hypothetical protein
MATWGARPPAVVGREVTVDDAALQLSYAAKVVIVPGYGLAAAQAQHEVVELAQALSDHGVDVAYGIHPVAGRMPGQMNVLLAEANAYDQLKDLDEINSQFANTDVVLVVGANDVTNPAARRPGNAVSGMPILDVDKARRSIVIKRSLGHGYAGIDNASTRTRGPRCCSAMPNGSLKLCSPSCTPTSAETRPRPTGDLRLGSARRALGILGYKQRRRCVMRALVIYESMYGNTHQIAEAIAEGMDLPDDVAVLPVSEATQTMLDQVDLIVVGGPRTRMA